MTVSDDDDDLVDFGTRSIEPPLLKSWTQMFMQSVAPPKVKRQQM